MMDYLLCGATGVTYYACYVQFHPSIGNIWIRNNSENKRTLQMNNLFKLMQEPFYNNTFWEIENWDLNWIVTTGLFIGGYHIFKTCFLN